ncbi:hypothetical protein MACK_000932 [Theileria orientalis]|uniref:Uncharacterized protein n=1 Tax=Theileria orientalis TaxID=68886 RepID=A0A976MAW3_THEOR|nr:hypothetical protein MACK_000932 [Theileria orientalis]
MEDISFNSYQRFRDIDPNITSISYLDNVVFLGNSYGDIKIIGGKGSEILHNHNGEVTALIAKRCCKTEEEDVVYLLSGTSIGNVYVHLVFLNRISDSRILYKFETGYSVFSICLHPKYRIYNFKRINRRLTVDFNEEVLKNYDYWSNLQNSSISVESFIIALSNGNIYLVYNALSINGYHNERREAIRSKREQYKEKYVIVYVSQYSPYVNMKVNWYKNYITWMDKNGFYIHQLPNFESILFISIQFFSNPNRRKTREKEAVNEKNVNYLSNIIDNGELYASTDESGITPRENSIESVLSQSFENLSGEPEGLENTECSSTHSSRNHSSQYGPTTRTFKTSSIGSGSTWYTRLMGGAKGCSSSVSGNSTVCKRRSPSSIASNVVGNEESAVTPESLDNSRLSSTRKGGERKYKLKRMRSKLVNYKYTRDNEHYGITSNFISDTVLVGCNNMLLCVKLINSTEEEFENYERLLLDTNQNKDLKGYTKNNVTKNRRSNNVVRGYIEYKIVLPQEFNIIYIKYNTKSQYDVITLNSCMNMGGSENLNEPLSKFSSQKREGCVCYKYNNDGRIYKYKIGGYAGYKPWGNEDLMNVVFDLKEGTIYCESIIAEGMSVAATNVIIGTTHGSEDSVYSGNGSRSTSIDNEGNASGDRNDVVYNGGDGNRNANTMSKTTSVGGDKKKSVYMYICNVLIHIGSNDNYISQLKYAIENSDTATVIEQFKNGLSSLFNSTSISSVGRSEGMECITPISYMYGWNDNNNENGALGHETVEENSNHTSNNGNKCYNNNTSSNSGKIRDKNKSAKYLLEYIGIFTEYLIKIQYYQGFKVLIQILNEYGIISQYLELVFTGNIRKSIRMMGSYEDLVKDIMETVGNTSVAYYKMLGWKMSEKMMKRLLNRIKEFLINHVQQLYEGIELVNSENNQMMDSAESEIMNIKGMGIGTNRNSLSNETYFNLLMLLKELKRNENSTGYNIYNLLYNLFTMTSGINSSNSSNYINTGNYVTGGNSQELYKHQASTTSLSYYVKQNEYLQIELLSLKYYYKALNDQLRKINTKGTIYYSKSNTNEVETTADSGTNVTYNTINRTSNSTNTDANVNASNITNIITNNITTTNRTNNTPSNRTNLPTTNTTTTTNHPGYIEKNAVNCNICNVTREVYAEVFNKLFDRVGGSQLGLPKGNNILYFSCNHLVHEKCQIRLINQLQQDHGRVKNLKMNTLNTDMLLWTCLRCLTI